MIHPTISVLIVSYNVKQYLLQCIDSIFRSDYSDKIEIIIVDNHSFDGSTKAISEKFPDVVIINNQKNVGFGKAVNQASKAASGDYLLILNPDTVVQENTISTFMNYASENTQVGIAGPKILNSDGSLQLAAKRSFPTMGVSLPKLLGLSILFPKSRWANRYNLTYLDPDKIHSVDAISGSCMFMRRDLFESLNGFDERFFMFGEDLDLCYRVKQTGKEIHYIPETQIIHYKGESVKSAPYNSEQAFHQAMILFYEKHFRKKIFTKYFVQFGVFIKRAVSRMMNYRPQIISISLDSISVFLAFILAIPIRFTDYEPIVASKGLVPLIYIVFWLSVGMLFQLYSRYILSYSRAMVSSFVGFFIAVAFTYFFKQYAFSRLVIIIATLIISILIPGWRLWMHYLASRNKIASLPQKQNYLFSRNTIIIGSNEEGLKIAKNIMRRVDIDLDIIGFCDVNLQSPVEKLPLPFLGRIDEIEEIIQTYGVRELIFSSQVMSYQNIIQIMNRTKNMHLTYRMVPRHDDILLGKSLIEDLGELSFVNIEYTLFHKFHLFTKRIFDFVISTSILIFTLPVIIVLSLAGKSLKKQYWGDEDQLVTGRVFDVKCQFIRILPLFWNVFKSEISIVGPGLIYQQNPKPGNICKPGLTGLDHIRFRKLEPKDRYLLDHYYAQHQGFTMDLEIILKTIIG